MTSSSSIDFDELRSSTSTDDLGFTAPPVPVKPSVDDEDISHCKHQYIEDWIDLSPDRSQSIWYCRYCECCPTGKTIACQVCKCRYPIASVWFVPSACTFVGDDEKTHKVCETCWWEQFVIETQCHACQSCKAVKHK